MFKSARRSIIALACMAAISFQAEGKTLSHDAYVWQRVWTPSLLKAIDSAPEPIHGWRLLVGQFSSSGHLTTVSLNWSRLAASSAAVTIVIRIDGQLGLIAEDALLDKITELAAHSRARLQLLSRIEIDHDCATERLATYAKFLTQLRRRLGPSWTMGITALPSWLESDTLGDVLRQVDEAVLQVHAVEAPTRSLFDPVRALTWTHRFSEISPKPFRISLPLYGARILTRDGRLLAVESEAPVLLGSTDSREMLADPAAVAMLVRELIQNPPGLLKGFAWFRLPVPGDRRTWSTATWMEVMQGRKPEGEVRVSREWSERSGLTNIVLINTTAYDLRQPDVVAMPVGCTAADGIGGYERSGLRPPLELRASQEGFLKPGGKRVIGWARCENGGRR